MQAPIAHLVLLTALVASCKTVSDSDIEAALDRDNDGVSRDDDCDDDDPTVGPGQAEFCNEIDDDCDGVVDNDASDAQSVFTDADGDGFGAGAVFLSCEPGSDEVAVDGDCDDAASDVHPDGTEICDGVDNDCDGAIDPGENDADADGIADCVDPEPYHEPFDGVAALADTEWAGACGSGSDQGWDINSVAMVFTGFYIWEGTGSPAVATGPDLADLATFTYEVRQSVDHKGGNSIPYNQNSVVWGFVDCSNYWMVRINDPWGYDVDGTDTWLSELRIVRRHLNSEVVLATVANPYTIGETELTRIRVQVDGEDITATWESLQTPSNTVTVSHTNTLFPSPTARVIGVAHGGTNQTIEHLYDDIVVLVP